MDELAEILENMQKIDRTSDLAAHQAGGALVSLVDTLAEGRTDAEQQIIKQIVIAYETAMGYYDLLG